MQEKVVALAPLSNEFNAFTSLFASALQDAGARPVEYHWGFRSLSRCDAVIFHWPEQLIASGEWTSALKQILRLRVLRRTHGLKVLWMAHNVSPHDSADGRSLLHSLFMNSLDGVIYLSRGSRSLVREAHSLPQRVVEQVTVHGPYPGPSSAFTPPAAHEKVRLASIGLVRPYKNLGELADATRGLAPSDIELAIIGKRHDPDYAAALEARASGNPVLRLQLSDTVISQTDLDAAIGNAHGIVLPYRKILNSGSAVHALSRGRPVLVPATGAMPELAELVGGDWVRLYDGAISEKVLREFAAHVRSLPRGAAPDLSLISWSRVTADLRRLFDKLF